MATEKPTCIDCGAPLARRGATRCRPCANKRNVTKFDHERASAAAHLRHERATENRRLAELARKAGLA